MVNLLAQDLVPSRQTQEGDLVTAMMLSHQEASFVFLLLIPKLETDGPRYSGQEAWDLEQFATQDS